MPDKAWKGWERTVARVTGGKRAGPTGNTTPDVIHPHYSIECKYQKRMSLRQADIEQAKRNAHTDKPWVLALKQHNMSGGYVVMELGVFGRLLEAAGQKPGE